MTTIAGLEIKKVATMAEPKSILLYGRPKRGKTRLGASLSKVKGYERGLIIDCEGGATSAAGPYPDVEVVVIDPKDGFAAAARQVSQILEELRQNTNGVADNYDWVMLDTVSTCSRWAKKALLDKHGIKGVRQAFGDLNDWIMDVMWDLQYMKPVGISCFHVRTDERELTHEVWTSPSVQGGARDSVANVPDLIGYLYIVNEGDMKHYMADFTPDEDREGGNRFDQVPKVPMANGDMSRLYEFIRGTKTSAPEAPKTKVEKAMAEAKAEAEKTPAS